MKNTCLFLMASLFLSSANALAAPVNAPFLVYSKNINPENKMIMFTQLNGNCQILDIHEGDEVFQMDFLWNMNNNQYQKPVNSLIKSAVRKRMQVQRQNENKLQVQMADLQEVNIGIETPNLQIISSMIDGKCVVSTYFEISESGKPKTVLLSELYAEVKKTLNPMHPKVIAVTIEGKDAMTGADFKARYLAKP